MKYIAPRRTDQDLASKLKVLQEIVEKAQIPSPTSSTPQVSQIETTLAQCAREVVLKGTEMYETNAADDVVGAGQG